jgi:ubiquinone/menaquinone biosynthesis C-methylase UbiE
MTINQVHDSQAYEVSELWDENSFDNDDRERVNSIARIIPKDVNSLVDIGCGSGLFVNALFNERGDIGRICGFDRSLAALKKVNCEKVVGDISRLPFCDEEFDMVVCNSVLEHIPEGKYLNAISEIVRVAKNYVYLSVPFEEDLAFAKSGCPKCLCSFNANYHLRSYGEKDLLSINSSLKPINIQRIAIHRVRRRFVERSLQAVKILLRGDWPPMPWWSICPACGYQPSKPTMDSYIYKSNNLCIGRFQSLLTSTRSRWIGALFKKTRN